MELTFNRREIWTIIFVFIFMLMGVLFYLIDVPIFFSFITEFFAGALGVLLAFSIESDNERTREKTKKEDLCRDLRDELREIQRTIGKEVMFFPDIWDSAIASGQLRLLSSDQTIVLTNVYRDVRRIQDDALRIRELDEKIRLAKAHSDFDKLDDLVFQKSPIEAIKKDREKKLLTKLENILKEDWLSYGKGEKNGS